MFGLGSDRDIQRSILLNTAFHGEHPNKAELVRRRTIFNKTTRLLAHAYFVAIAGMFPNFKKDACWKS